MTYVPINSLWVIKIGDRVVGMARLVQDGPHSAEIVLFRIDPEWSHTKVPLNLIRSIESYCQNHGRLSVAMQAACRSTLDTDSNEPTRYPFKRNKTRAEKLNA